MKTQTRQIKNWIETNQYFETLRTFDKYNYLKGQFKVKGYTSFKGTRTDVNTIAFNSVYFAAHRELKHKFGISNEYNVISGKFEILYYSINWNVRLDTNTGKFTLALNPGMYDNDLFMVYLPFSKKTQVSYEYKGELSKEAINSYINSHYLKTYLYPPGRWRDLQLLYNWKKNNVREAYRYHVNAAEVKNPESYSREDIEKWILKHFNINISLIYDTDQAVSAVNKLGRQKKVIKLSKYDMSWIYDFDGNCNEIEAEYYNSLESDTIYIN